MQKDEYIEFSECNVLLECSMCNARLECSECKYECCECSECSECNLSADKKSELSALK